MVVVPGVAPSDRVCGPNVLHDAGMVHRHVRRSSLEGPDRVATSLHDGGDECIRRSRRTRRVVRELVLDRSPALGESIALVGRQGTDPRLFDVQLPLLEPPVGALWVGLILSGAVIRRVVMLAKRIGTLLPLTQPDRETDHDEGCDPQHHHHSGIHENLRRRTSPGPAGRRRLSTLRAMGVDGASKHRPSVAELQYDMLPRYRCSVTRRGSWRGSRDTCS
jgi:hypothetical protein